MSESAEPRKKARLSLDRPSFNRLTFSYFASYLAVLLLVMLALVFFAYRSFSSFHAQILQGRYQANLSLLQDAQDHLCSSLIAIAGQMTGNDITPVRFEDDPVKASRFSAKLASYRAVNDTFSDIFIHFTGDDYIYSTTSFFRMDRFTKSALVLEHHTAQELQEALEDTSTLTIWPAQHLEGYAQRQDALRRQFVIMFVPLSYPGGARVGTVMCVVDESVYEGWIRRFGLEDAKVSLLHREIPVYTHLFSDDALQALSTEDQTLRLDGQTWHIFRDGQESGNACLALVNDLEFAVALSSSVKGLVLVCAVIAAVALLLITLLVQTHTRPILLLSSMLRLQNPENHELMEIRDGVQKLIDENTSMSVRLEDMKGTRKREFVRTFLLDGFPTEDACLRAAEEASVNVDAGCFAVAVIAKAAESSYELTPEKIDRLFDDEVSGASMTPLSPDQRLMVLLFGEDETTLRQFLTAKFSGLKACSSSITMGVSAIHRGFADGKRAYLEAESAFDMRFVFGSASPIFFSDLKDGSSTTVEYNRQAVDHLRQALHAGDETRTQEALQEVSQAMHDTRSSLFGFRCMYSDIITSVSAEATSSGVKEEELVDLYRLSRCLSLEELDGILKGVCTKLSAMNAPAAMAPADVPEEVQRARDLIARRFSEPGLTVSSIAEAVGMSDSRLSVAFKKVYGQTPLECITQSRMHRAKRLLTTTDMPVKDIAVECGYYDISAFNRRFKTYHGCTPQQLRKSPPEGSTE
ncbi:MAG: helix-turn-helix transcriptional regulator [Clostridia bacterium]|nr:helix-turn-helix transcriptional regulator [Clostridia bacterium]